MLIPTLLVLAIIFGYLGLPVCGPLYKMDGLWPVVSGMCFGLALVLVAAIVTIVCTS